MTTRVRRLSRAALLMVSIATAIVVWIGWYGGGTPSDARAFYDPVYGGMWGFIYTPAFTQATAPLRLLPFDVFVGLVRAIEIAIIVALCPYGAWLALFLPPVAAEVNAANINMVLGLCVVLGIRYPATWAVPLLTKPSIALALTAFLARRDVRRFALAVAPAVVIAGISFALDPGAWFDYLRALAVKGDIPGWPFPIAIWPRIPIAIAIAIVGRNRPWAYGVAAIIAWPRLYFQSIALLLILIPLSAQRWPSVPGTSEARAHLRDRVLVGGRRLVPRRVALHDLDAGRVVEHRGLE